MAAPKRHFGKDFQTSSNIKISAIGPNEKNKVQVIPYEGMKFQNRDGFLKLDLDELDKFDLNTYLQRLASSETKEEEILKLLHPLSYQFQRSTVSEYEFDDYYWESGINYNKGQFTLSGSSKKAQEKKTDSNQNLSSESSKKNEGEEQSVHQDVFVKILGMQQLLLKEQMHKCEQKKKQKKYQSKQIDSMQAVIDKNKSYLKRSKAYIQKLKEEVNDLNEMAEQTKQRLLTKCAYSCNLCPKKIFKTEEYLKQHMKRRHPGMLDMRYDDTNYQMMQNIKQLSELMVQRKKFHEQYFNQESQRINQEISDEVIQWARDESFNFKQNLLDFQETCIISFNKRYDVVQKFNEQNEILSIQNDLLLEEFVKLQQEIREAEDFCIQRYIEKDKQRAKEEADEIERQAELVRKEVERKRKAKEDSDRLKKERKEKEKADKIRKGRNIQGVEISEKDTLKIQAQLKKKQDEEQRKRELEIIQDKMREKEKRIKKLKSESLPQTTMFNFLVDNRRKGNKNYSDSKYDDLLSTQLFDKFNKLMSRFKITQKIDEITVKTSQIAQLEEILSKVQGGMQVDTEESAQQEHGGKSKLDMLKEEKSKIKYEIDVEPISEEEEEVNPDGTEQILTQEQILAKQEKILRKNPLFNKKGSFHPYYQSYQSNPKFNNLNIQKEDRLNELIQIQDIPDSYFHLRQVVLAKSKEPVQYGYSKLLNKYSHFS